MARVIMGQRKSGPRSAYLGSASLAALAIMAAAEPAAAQLAARRGAMAAMPAPRPGASLPRSEAARTALDRTQVGLSRAESMRAFVLQARAAAQAAVRTTPSEGLSANGLVPIAPVREAIMLSRAGDSARAAALVSTLAAARDATGAVTWQGAGLPTESDAANGGKLVTIVQTEARAILSWDRFDVGKNTTVQFDQKVGGVAQTGWVALNRVTGSASPSTILGSIKADGTVLLLNRRGIIFGAGSQVNANALLASSLEIGNAAGAGAAGRFRGLSLSERNVQFLSNGLLQQAPAIGTLGLAPTLVASMIDSQSFEPGNYTSLLSGETEGSIIVDRDAKITAGRGGFVILTAPKVVNDGSLSATEGQVSLQAGRAISYLASTGGAGSVDRDIRGLILRTIGGAGSEAVNSGLISVPRGYISVGAGLDGSITNAGFLESTTSVSRNGVVSLTAGRISLAGSETAAQAAGIRILPDSNGETIPLGTLDEPANFLTSRIDIGGVYLSPGDFGGNDDLIGPLGQLGPAQVSIGRNAAIITPGANLNIGGRVSEQIDPVKLAQVGRQLGVSELTTGNIDIADGATIDVGGIKDLQLDASRNSLLIDPLKRNELRDTPLYREAATGGGFTLNGAAVYVDPRRSGVRVDGVRWIGSPLIEAASAASQVGVTAAELMTRGGNVFLATGVVDANNFAGTLDLAKAPRVTIAQGARVDFSGGWVRYADGIVRSSRLMTRDGRIVDIADADPNDDYVAVGDGFTEFQSRFGVARTFANALLGGARFEEGYSEGRDAGTLQISATTASISGQLHGDAFAGARQITDAREASARATLAGDLRRTQASAGELPAHGVLRLGNLNYEAGLTADILVGTAGSGVSAGTTLLSDTSLNAAKLGGLSLKTTAGVAFSNGSDLVLAPGGYLDVSAGRSIAFDGSVSAPSGRISAQTLALGRAPQFDIGLSSFVARLGSPFSAADDAPPLLDVLPTEQRRLFDITVDGSLSTAGQWSNDFGRSVDTLLGGAWTDGGTISLQAAPKVYAAVGTSNRTATAVVDYSGSVIVKPDSELNVSAGGYIATDGAFNLSAKGGNISLLARMSYAALQRTDPSLGSTGTAGFTAGGGNQTVDFTPYGFGVGDSGFEAVPSLVPDVRIASVSFSADSLKGFGFSSGGTFTLDAPSVSMGSGETDIGLDFFERTGFGTVNVSSLKSRFIRNIFDNGRNGTSAFLDTTRFVVAAGDTLDLTQTLLPSILDPATTRILLNVQSGSDITTILTPSKPADAFDRRAATLRLDGLTELEIEAGGTITGATGASIVAPRIYNAGTIRIAGGSVLQQSTLPALFNSRTIGVRDQALGGTGLAGLFGESMAGQTSRFDENAATRLPIFADSAQTRRLTNGNLFNLVDATARGFDTTVVFTGRTGLDQGIVLTAGSVTDLSGTALYNPRASFLAGGRQQRTGRVVDGGRLSTSVAPIPGSSFSDRNLGVPNFLLAAEPGARIDLSGTSGLFDDQVSATSIDEVRHWSNGGRLTIGDGALLTGVAVRAVGGDDGDADPSRTRAMGGTIDVVDPVLRQSDIGGRLDGSALVADQIKAAGFDTLFARRSLSVEGTVNLSLGRAVIGSGGLAGSADTQRFVVNALPGADGRIAAPYVRLSGSANGFGSLLSTQAGEGRISFSAKAIDLAGAIELNVSARSALGSSRGRASFESSGDIRLIGASTREVNTALAPGLTGGLISNGDLAFEAAQVYATTGTGNLQQLIEAQRAGKTVAETPFLVGSTSPNGIVSFAAAPGDAPAAPLSAGSFVRVLAPVIEQNGRLRTPLGRIDLGANAAYSLGNGIINFAPTRELTLGEGSLTSVSGSGLNVPYGTTTDLLETFFEPVTADIVTAAPVGELRLAGRNISIAGKSADDIRVDARGGGDVYAYEFIPGTGGSRDVLDRSNPDIFSGNDGLQFADGRQVFAILPRSAETVALFDPLYSSGYVARDSVDLYGAQAGRTVTLDAAPGIEAGEYLLLPAKYATLPGALRIVENTGSDAPPPGSSTQLRDGTLLVGGNYSVAGTDFAESQRRSFTVQSQDVLRQYSRIETVSGNENAVRVAAKSDSAARFRTAADAARVVISPLASIKAAGAFATAPEGNGRGAQIDLAATRIRVTAPGATATPETAGFLLLGTDTLERLGANSLSIGAVRAELADGTTRLDVQATDIRVDGNVRLSAPELILAVGRPGSRLTVDDGARITASGKLADDRSRDYVINATALAANNPQSGFDQSGVGSVIRVANGAERLITRQGDFLERNSLQSSRLDIGGATLSGQAIALDSTRGFVIDRNAKFAPSPDSTGFVVALSADALRLGGFSFRPEVEAQLAAADRLTLRSPDVIGFFSGTHSFKDLTIDAPGIGLAFPIPATATTNNVTINAENVVLRNSSADRGGCNASGFNVICEELSALTLNARTIAFGSGNFGTYGFGQTVDALQRPVNGITLSAREGMFIEGAGRFSTFNRVDLNNSPFATPVALILNTPFIVDRSPVDASRKGYVRPDYSFENRGDIRILGSASAIAPPVGSEAPGASIAFKAGFRLVDSVIYENDALGGDLTISNVALRATAGGLDLQALGSITVDGASSLATPGYTRTFDDGVDKITVSASGGRIDLLARAEGNIRFAPTTTLIVDSGIGKAGALSLLAPGGTLDLGATLNPGIGRGTARDASFRVDSGQSAFDLAAFVARDGAKFGGNIDIRTGIGNLVLNQGQSLLAENVVLTADGGRIDVAGTIDVSGKDARSIALTDPKYKDIRVNGGNISLFGQGGLTLASSARLISTSAGYADGDTRQASGGDVVLGIGTDTANPAQLAIDTGAVIDLRALRPGDRLIEDTAKDASGVASTVFRLAEADRGGTLTLRAPIQTGVNGDFVNIRTNGGALGARENAVEAYRTIELDAVFASSSYSGLVETQILSGDPRAQFSGLSIDPAATRNNRGQTRPNFFVDLAPGTIPSLVRNFSVSAASGADISAFRVRPGFDLVSSGDLAIGTIWNLGAGRIVNADGTPGYADAVAADLMVESGLGAYDSGPLKGQTRYEVVAGKEAELFSRFVDLTYRVGGKVTGEAPVLSLRSPNKLAVGNSITDGFFTFHDTTNPDFISYQLGGGKRTYSPAINFSCGVQSNINCNDSVKFDDVVPGLVASPAATRVSITLLNAIQGLETSAAFARAPYSPEANAAAAGNTGDPIGVGELFPLINGKDTARSSSLRLVGGAVTQSANPLQIDRSQSGGVSISGERSYELTAKQPSVSLNGPLQFVYRYALDPNDPTGGNLPLIGNVDGFLDFVNGQGEEVSDAARLDPEYYTLLTWGAGASGSAAAARDAALAPDSIFVRNGRTFFGPRGSRTSVAAPLSEVIAFLGQSSFGGAYRQGVESGRPGFNVTSALVSPTVRLANDTAFVPTTVRTGDGRIDIAAAQDISLLRTGAAVSRRLSIGGQNAQVGGTAVYTAGVRATAAQLRGAALPELIVDTAQLIPGPARPVSSAPVLSTNGGAVTLQAGQDVLGRRDVWSEVYGASDVLLNGVDIGAEGSFIRTLLASRGYPVTSNALGFSQFGESSFDQRWRTGLIGQETRIGITPNGFTSGVAALGGGDVSIEAGGTVSDLSVALSNSVVIGRTQGARTLVSLGGGDLFVTAASGDLLGGQFDIASGQARVFAGGEVDASAGEIRYAGVSQGDVRNLLRLRISDATLNLSARGDVTFGEVGALGVGGRSNPVPDSTGAASGFYSATASATITTLGDVTDVGNRIELFVNTAGSLRGRTVLPPSLSFASLQGNIGFGSEDLAPETFANLFQPRILYPSRYGQLSLLAGGNIENFSLAMSDAAPADFGGFAFGGRVLGAGYPAYLPGTSDARLRAIHNAQITHLSNPEPVRIFAQGSIENAILTLPKQARITAGGDISNLYFEGQNVNAADTTRIFAGRDITATTNFDLNTGRSVVFSNNFILGGPGSLIVEAGRNLGPFATSATIDGVSFGGGIRTIGNEANPWLGASGANIYALFGTNGNAAAIGADYANLQATYLNPANLEKLDGDLFVQKEDVLGNESPDRTKPVYAPILAIWLRDNAPRAFATVFGNSEFANDGALVDAAFGRYAALYAEFEKLSEFQRRRFLIDRVYFGELAAAADPNGPSANQFVRGYRAVQTLFPANRGFTDNLATYETDQSTIDADHPLGQPVKKLVNGQPAVADRKNTGSVDLRLATVQTARGGDISILGPGGDFVAGSIVRTSAQIARRSTILGGFFGGGRENGQYYDLQANRIDAIPIGFEGVLTLRGGAIRSFTDGNFQLNQSRLFTQRGGDITLWSSNADLNAGQGPKSASNFPPVKLRFNPNGFSEVDSAGSVSGAGIAAFRPAPDVPTSRITLLAPVGTVDAGDAGVRASGDVFVAAARVANADNFKVGGQSFGVPSLAVSAAPTIPASATSAIAANAFKPNDNPGGAGRSRLFVDVLGYFGGGQCPEGQVADANGQCTPSP